MQKYRIDIHKKGIIVLKNTNSIQININGRSKSFANKELDKQNKNYKNTYPKIEEDIDEVDGSLVNVKADIVGIVSEVFVEEGQFVRKGEILLSISAMKVENEVRSPIKGRIKKIFVKKGQLVKENLKLILIKNENL